MSRRPISQRIRFEIFKRDEFTCQYCGRKAPRVILHCDHIEPIARGGTDRWENLVTACADCNLGKRDVPLPTAKVVEFQEKYDDPPYMTELTEACTILISRIEYFVPSKVFPLMKDAVEFGARPKEITELCGRVETWEEFETVLTDFVADGVPFQPTEMTLQ